MPNRSNCVIAPLRIIAPFDRKRQPWLTMRAHCGHNARRLWRSFLACTILAFAQLGHFAPRNNGHSDVPGPIIVVLKRFAKRSRAMFFGIRRSLNCFRELENWFESQKKPETLRNCCYPLILQELARSELSSGETTSAASRAKCAAIDSTPVPNKWLSLLRVSPTQHSCHRNACSSAIGETFEGEVRVSCRREVLVFARAHSTVVEISRHDNRQSG